MQLLFDSDALTGVISRLTKVISNPSEVHLVVKDGKCFVSASSEGFLVSLSLKADCKKDGFCSVEFNSFKTVFKNRKTVELKLEGTKLFFKATNSKSFAGNLVTQDYTKHRLPSIKDSKTVPTEQVDFISDVLKNMSIEDFYFKKPLSFTCFSKDKLAYCYVTSTHHMAIAKKSCKKDFVEFTLPLKCLSSIIAVMDGKFSFSIEESRIIVTNKAGDIVVNPLESVEDAPKKEKVLGMYDELQSSKRIVAKAISIDSVKDSMAAFSSLKSEKSTLQIESTKTGLELSMSSTKGTLNQTIKCKVKNKGKILVNPDMLSNFIRIASKDSFTLSATDRAFSLFTEQSENALCYLGAQV